MTFAEFLSAARAIGAERGNEGVIVDVSAQVCCDGSVSVEWHVYSPAERKRYSGASAAETLDFFRTAETRETRAAEQVEAIGDCEVSS